jgi:hypothetical protein
MGTISRNVRDLQQDERRVYETALGEKLRENQAVILQVVDLGAPKDKAELGAANQPLSELPVWCNVYEGLSDGEIAEIETLILDRSGWTRDPS